MTKLEEARLAINRIDAEMTKLFCERMEAVGKVAEYKKENGMQIFDETREKEVLARNVQLCEQEVLKPYYLKFMEETMAVSKQYQKRLLTGRRVAYCGVKGAFAYMAAKEIFPDSKEVSYPDFAAAYRAVVEGECDNAVLPLENSFEGDVTQVMDLAFFGPLFISGIYQLEIKQNLLTVPGAKLTDIRKVISHPQALGQCAPYLKKLGVEIEECSNTAVAAQRVAELGDKSVAAVASEETAKLYGLSILEKGINEKSNNITRFAVFTKSAAVPTEKDKQFIMYFTVNNHAGSLGRVTSIFGEYGINLRALRSRPTKELVWEYYFYVEGEGNTTSERFESMMEALKECTAEIKMVAVYEKDVVLRHSDSEE